MSKTYLSFVDQHKFVGVSIQYFIKHLKWFPRQLKIEISL